MTPKMNDTNLSAEITSYLSGGGLFNPELADHDAVRDLLIRCRTALTTNPAAPADAGLARGEKIIDALRNSLMGTDEAADNWTFAGMEDAFFRWPVVERELRHVLSRLTASEAQPAQPALRVSPADAFDMGRVWQQMLVGQTLEDSRAVGRTLGCDLFKPIQSEINAAEKEIGFNPFTSADEGICTAIQIIRAALAAPVTELRQCCVEERERWQPYHSVTSLSFEPGVFNLNRSGSASIAVRESEIEWETDDESSATYIVMNLPAGEAEAIRKWLNAWLPVPAIRGAD